MVIGPEKGKHELRKDIRGVGAVFELARRRLRANPSRAFCARDVKVTTDSSTRVKVRIKVIRNQLYPLDQLLGPSNLGQPFLLKGTKRIGPYILEKKIGSFQNKFFEIFRIRF